MHKKIKITSVLLPFAYFFLCSPSAWAKDYECKLVGKSWVWFSDHIALAIEYKVVGPERRRYEVGTGIFAFGGPLGAERKLEYISQIMAFGMGAMHIRRSDSGEDFKVCVTAGDLDPITIFRAEF